jgi:hypothetical protein
MPRVYWTCPVCEHEALDYDEVDHDCIDPDTGEETEYVAQGDEAVREPDDFDMER